MSNHKPAKDEGSRWVALASRNPDEFMQAISWYYPLDEQLIERYADRWNWGILSCNEPLPWSESLIKHYADRWDWERLSGYGVFSWSEPLVEPYADRWDWEQLSCNESIPWSESLINRFEDQWDWNKLGDESFPMSLWLLEPCLSGCLPIKPICGIGGPENLKV